MKEKFKNIKNYLKKSFNFVDKNNKFNFMEVVVFMIITTIFGMFVGGVLMYGKGALNVGIKRELKEFVETYTEILNEYYEEIPENELLEAGVRGMIGYLGDPYSVYMDKEASEKFDEKISGEYVGIGTKIMKTEEGRIEFIEVDPEESAYKAGIRKGDFLLKIDDKDITEKEVTEISKMVKGKLSTKLKITILRKNEEKTFEVERQNVDLVSVTSEIIPFNNQEIGYIKIDIFAANTFKQFKHELEKLEKEKIKSLIIDVRANSGGYLSVATDVLSMFIKKGELIYQLKTKEKIEKIYDKTEENRTYKVAILVNGGSASASEVLASAMKDVYGAYTIGTNTYGKSKVQKTQDFENGSKVKFTYQEWLTSTGEIVSENGIIPEYQIIYEINNTESKYDTQLQKALELLGK